MSTQVEWQVLNPTAEYETARYHSAPRMTAIDGQRIGLLWNSKACGDTLLRALGGLLQEQYKDIKLINYDLRINIGAENIKKIAAECDAVIGSVGD